jgi:hypothetical protein
MVIADKKIDILVRLQLLQVMTLLIIKVMANVMIHVEKKQK